MSRNLFIFALVIGTFLSLSSCKKESNPVDPPVNNPPDALTNVYPRDHQLDMPLQQMYVEWSCSDPDGDSLTYDVFFGESENPTLVSQSQTSRRYLTDTLEYDKTYYWKVIARDEQDSVVSAIWNFATMRLPNQPPELPVAISPPDGSDNQSINADLRWTCSDPEHDILTYDVYFGTSTPPPLIHSGQIQENYELDTLEFITTYYWKIAADDGEDHTTDGNIWSFTTLEETRGTDPGELREFELGNSGLMIEMVWIPAGSFMMGAMDNELDAISDEYPRHQVTFDYDFWMSRYELTQQQWSAIAGSNPSNFVGDNLPVEQVSWNDAHQFIDQLNEQTDSAPFRLPSEAEWEYACRAGTDSRFPWGNDTAYSALYRYGWYDEISEGFTHEVGQKRANDWGLYDMHGNVWEWCEDWYHSSYEGAPTDGSAWTTIDNGATRIRRGGSWNYPERECRSAYRFRASPSRRYSSLGVRLVKDAG